ncbi:peptidase M48 Ste24p [Desulfovibrio sp. X2]|uniref:M48 family metallopeptidase n=1 Tax=Desulfovibrio sp. X2 TaxID=941449 RepID=UPI000358A685|nr:M48 family metallopeptidase [Desulfovibrio sp. X2]EPR43640.1 peptidase M48 Ste24p [Desulfovibrio sp. X2]
MKTRFGKRFLIVLGLLLATAVLTYCTTTPYTDRSQFMLVSQQEELQLGQQAAAQVLKTEKVSKDPEINARVRRIGERLAKVSVRPDYKWEFYVIDKDEANAFCLPGGKVFVYTGILKYAPTDAELATVMGHEIAHALLRHGAERMSTALALEGVGTVGSLALGGSGSVGGQVFAQSYGMVANVGVLLPFSRDQESEADKVGLELMAQAGYDPAAALTFWEHMAKDEDKSKKPPVFLSTHPPTAERIEAIRDLLPWAKTFYHPRD